jgi:antitoxin HicB
MSFRYPIVARPDDNGTYLVTSPAFPEVTTFGADEAECVARGAAAIEEAIAARMAAGADIPGDALGRQIPAIASSLLRFRR